MSISFKVKPLQEAQTMEQGGLTLQLVGQQ